MSNKWLDAATLPFRPSTPRIGPNPKTAALMKANRSGAMPTPPGDDVWGSGGELQNLAARRGQRANFLSVIPAAPPARVLPPARIS